MKSIEGRLLEESNGRYRIAHKREFKVDGIISVDDVEVCFDFSYEMAFGEGEHRDSRSGGEKHRKEGEIFINTFQGKLAEFAMYRYMRKIGLEITAPDLQIQGLGVWDSFDLECDGIHIAVKSTKFYGNLLLLETKDWSDRGEYLPNAETGVKKYDFFVLLRISPDGEKKMKERALLYSTVIERGKLHDIICTLEWKYNIAGYITNKDFMRLIKQKYIIPKGALLNGKIPMDAENYYVQAGDMRQGEELPKHIQKYKLMFERGLTK